MSIFAKVLIALIAGIHVYIFIFEAFFWEQRGAKVFRSFPEDLFSKTNTSIEPIKKSEAPILYWITIATWGILSGFSFVSYY